MVKYPIRLRRFRKGYQVCYNSLSLWVITTILALPTFAGEAEDLIFIQQVNPIIKEKAHQTNSYNLKEHTELQLVASGMIRLYQRFISSQDGPTCNFTPTCSRFGMACIQEYGMFRGILLTADRLLRCNGSQSNHYHKDIRTRKYKDPISDYAK